MKENLNDQSRKDLIDYRLSRAIETLEEAEYNAKGGYYNAAVNRLYYACYYAASALMLNARLDVSTHKGILNQLGFHFIKTGILEQRFGSIYARLYNARQVGDYEDFIFCDSDMYNEYKPLAKDFVLSIASLLSGKSL